MNTQQRNKSAINPRALFVATSLILVALAILASGCRDGQNDNHPQPSASPCPSPSPSLTPNNYLDGDSPIIINGGSSTVAINSNFIEIKFPENVYAPPTPNPTGDTVYHSTGNQILGVEVIEEGDTSHPVRLWVPTNGKCTVTIHSKQPGAGGQDRPIIVTGDPATGAVDVKFNNTEYGPGSGKQHYNPNNKLTDYIEVRDDNAGGNTYYYKVPASGKADVTVRTSIVHH